MRETPPTTSGTITAESAGTFRLGDLPVRRIGFGAMRLTGSAAFHPGTPSDRERSLAVLRRAGLGFRDPDTDELLALCREQGIAFVPCYAIAGALRLTGEEPARLDGVRTG